MTKLSVYEFGRRLLETKDLDPVYVLLWEAKLSAHQLKQWLLGYWCFYHVGTASWLSEHYGHGDDVFWGRMNEAAWSKSYPRSPERRHFRGDNARKSVAFLQEVGLGTLFDGFPRPSCSASDVIEYVTEWVGFGPWIAFKVADMMERLGLIDVSFDLKTTFYDGSPTEGAQLLWRVEHPGQGRRAPKKDETSWAADRILNTLWNDRPGVDVFNQAPPRYERPINLQEAETILCKWKSYMGGHYHIGEDVQSCRNGLLEFARCRTSQRLLAAGKKGGLW